MKKILLLLAVIIFSLELKSQEQNDFVVTDQILINGNKTTHRDIILRETTFQEGDTILRSQMSKHFKESRQNLINTSLFNFADVIPVEQSPKPNHINVAIILTERWYIWPIPYIRIADRNFTAYFEEGKIDRLSFGGDIIHRNFLGRQHFIDLTLIFGYNQNYGILYEIPYLTRKKKLGISFSLNYLQAKEYIYQIENDKVKYFHSPSGAAQAGVIAKITPCLRFGHHDKLSLTMSYHDLDFNDSLAFLNSDFINDESTRFQYFSLSAVFKHDYRDVFAYPLNGYYAEIELTKKGLGIMKNSVDFYYAKLTLDRYFSLGGRWYWASNLTTRLASTATPPIFINRALGYDNDIVRTYELYVIDAQNFTIFKNNLKFEIYKKAEGHINGINNDSFGKYFLAFYANLFCDFAYTWHGNDTPKSKLYNELLFGTGLGIDVVTYYDRVFRFEYGFNALGEGCFSIHLVAPI